MVSMESVEEHITLKEQPTRSETPTAAWPEQQKGIWLYLLLMMHATCYIPYTFVCVIYSYHRF